MEVAKAMVVSERGSSICLCPGASYEYSSYQKRYKSTRCVVAKAVKGVGWIGIVQTSGLHLLLLCFSTGKRGFVPSLLSSAIVVIVIAVFVVVDSGVPIEDSAASSSYSARVNGSTPSR